MALLRSHFHSFPFPKSPKKFDVFWRIITMRFLLYTVLHSMEQRKTVIHHSRYSTTQNPSTQGMWAPASENLIPWEKKLISKSKWFWWWLANLPRGEKQNFSPPSLPYLSPPCLSPVPQNSPSVSLPATFIRSLVPPEILFSTVMCLMSGICATL